ncbi:hypothetical protein [Undibacterium parvum]|uniref:Uncharacterized protein n=1 Tax=Undibacterium parvum TaxID=401471 RepID=A0A3S9HFL5_9BURK|nr:hypothetical protein [Undibacterium parvum]AZP10906.1 hypothetical protein EJN92_02045 [Undibacterium parvum]
MRLVVWPSMTQVIVLSVQSVMQGRINQYKAWMIRAYSLGHGAGSQVLIMLPMTLIASAPTFFFRDVLITSA